MMKALIASLFVVLVRAHHFPLDIAPDSPEALFEQEDWFMDQNEWFMDQNDDDINDDTDGSGGRKLLTPPGMITSRLTNAQLISWPHETSVDRRPLSPPIMQQHLNGSRCGACWAFATAAGISIAHAQKTGQILQLSQQQLVSCDAYGRGCGGGGTFSAIKYVYENNGIATAEAYPYVAKTGTCNKTLADETVVQVKGYHRLPKTNETAMEIAIGKGPLMVGINTHGVIYSAWHNYTGGILDPTDICNSTNDYCNGHITHFVTLVGMTDIEGVPVWIVRNSWGDEWGDEGYAYVPRNRGTEGMFNLARAPCFPLV